MVPRTEPCGTRWRSLTSDEDIVDEDLSATLKVRPEPLQRGLANTQLILQSLQENGVVNLIEGSGQVQKTENHRLLPVQCTQKVIGNTNKSRLALWPRGGRQTASARTVFFLFTLP